MKAQFSHVHWVRVLLTGVLVVILNTVVLLLVIAVYAASLGIQTRGHLDQAQIAQFANQVVLWGGPILAILLTFGGAVWVAHKVEIEATLHGLLVGLVAAISSLIIDLAFGMGLNLASLLTFVLIGAAGWLGGVLGNRGHVKSEPGGIFPS